MPAAALGAAPRSGGSGVRIRGSVANSSSKQERGTLNQEPGRSRFFDTYTRDLSADDLRRLFTRDTKEAYRFFTRHVDFTSLDRLPWHRRALAKARLLFLAFTMKLSPARRIV